MSKINFYLKNYFQSSDLEYEEVDSDNLYSQIIDNVIKTRAYPFSKKELLEYLTTDEFLISMYLNSSEKMQFIHLGLNFLSREYSFYIL